MRGSYRTAMIVETRTRFLGRLRHRVWTVEQKDRDLVVGLLCDIHHINQLEKLEAGEQD